MCKEHRLRCQGHCARQAHATWRPGRLSSKHFCSCPLYSPDPPSGSLWACVRHPREPREKQCRPHPRRPGSGEDHMPARCSGLQPRRGPRGFAKRREPAAAGVLARASPAPRADTYPVRGRAGGRCCRRGSGRGCLSRRGGTNQVALKLTNCEECLPNLRAGARAHQSRLVAACPRPADTSAPRADAAERTAEPPGAHLGRAASCGPALKSGVERETWKLVLRMRKEEAPQQPVSLQHLPAARGGIQSTKQTKSWTY